jgi:hypothetical protein
MRAEAASLASVRMNKTDIERVQTYLRRLFGTDRIQVVPPARAGMSVELTVNEEVVGTIHKDVEDGETSYAIHMTILEEDLPSLPRATTPARGRGVH